MVTCTGFIVRISYCLSRKLVWKTLILLTHWGRVMHISICVSKLTTIGSDNGLSPGRRQAIIWTNAGILLIGTLETNFSEIVSEIHAFSFTKMHLKMSFGTWRPFCVGLNVLTECSNAISSYMSAYELLDIFNPPANCRNSQYETCPSKQNWPHYTQGMIDNASLRMITITAVAVWDHNWPKTFFGAVYVKVQLYWS